MTQRPSGYPYSPDHRNREGSPARYVADATSEKIKDAASSAQDMAGKVADQVREYGDQAQDAVKQVRPFLERSLEEKPMATLAGTAAIAFAESRPRR
jgi:ABC-type transporter Mla subunit MlaD